ncbi:MAG: DUF1080 domain-containing protein [Pirellulaceae bacterium]|jgi:hypothetical protein|nr:DUF1080 domain-containing protein [Pirellulaceae bacterium]MDP7016804.1 DUF1080 domain-containing protein [Pirellulaceae bacterium]
MRFPLAIFAAALVMLPIATVAKGPKISDPAKVDKDFAFQGEFSGEIGEEKAKLGVQVIALGEGNFRAVGYLGGLPGDGWDTTKEKIITDGKLVGDSVEFKRERGTGIVQGGKFILRNKEGVDVATLDRIERKSPTLGAKPPKNAVVLFDGKSADNFKGGRLDGKLLMQGVTSKQTFGSHTIHVEFRLPYQPQDRGQGRGNSGIYVQGRYEIQMLDSFGLDGKQNECGGLYSVKDPDVNMCLPPLAWQTYDIEYTAATFDEAGKLKAHPRVTVKHNGVVIHNDVELPGNRSTTAAPSKPGPKAGPVFLQDHGCPVRYRNIWVVEKK